MWAHINTAIACMPIQAAKEDLEARVGEEPSAVPEEETFDELAWGCPVGEDGAGDLGLQQEAPLTAEPVVVSGTTTQAQLQDRPNATPAASKPLEGELEC